MQFRMEIADAVRAAHDAVAAADAPGAVDEYDSVLGLIGGSDRADLDTGRVVAMVAELGDEEGLGDLFRFDLLHTRMGLVDLLGREAVAGTFGRVDQGLAVL